MGLETLAFAAAAGGAGLQLFGSVNAASHNKDIADQEMKIQANNQRMMELDARRKQMEVIRNQQRAHSMALTAASAQGAQFSSGLQGSYGQIADQGGNNLLGINQNLTIGRQNAQFNQNISQDRMALADDQMWQSFGQGLQSFGGSVMKIIPGVDRLAPNFGKGFGGPYI